MKRRLVEAASLLLGLAVLGALIAASGVVPIKASSGHWGVTEAVLQFSKRRSIATHTLGADAPALEAPWLVLKGAGHYETGCRPCHGSPGVEQPRVARSMTPRPPELTPRVARYEPEELFYIVKHGIKFTGMPAWPSLSRDDEVGAMVAFLRELPKLDANQYQRLVHGTTAPSDGMAPIAELDGEPAPRSVATSCARCHGADGQGRGNAAFPKLAGQRREYLLAALNAFANDQRYSGFMQPIAAASSPDERAALADYYARLPERASKQAVAGTEEIEAEGARIARDGIPAQGVPSCVDCHGPGSHVRNPAYPLLAGQYADYLVLQLELFQQGKRGGSPYAHLMAQIASRLNPEQMRKVASYYASLDGDAAR